MASEQNIAERGIAIGLRALNWLGSSDLVDRLGLRESTERFLRGASRGTARTAARAGRTFAAAQKRSSPARQPKAGRTDLFDLTPDEEQRMLQESVREFALARLRPVAHDADEATAPPPELMSQAVELGLTMVGVPEELGGAVERRSAVTAALMSEALAQGDLGLAVACMAPAAVSTALGLWGDADQQATYLPELVGENPPAAALAILEPRALSDPFALRTRATRNGDGFVLEGIKSLVPRAADGELFIVGAQLEDGDPAHPALFLVESKTPGISVEPEPAMGVRAAATGRLVFENVSLPAGALLADGDPAVFTECVHLARLGWCAMAVGTAQAVVDYVIPYVKERRAFGEPIGHRQGVAFTVANMAIELEGMRLATYRAASRADQGLPFAREAALARRLCSERGAGIGSDGVQMLGGHGFVKEHPVERWYRDLRAAGVMEGALLI
jgi:alkylation response protein AidB-like acyl-CoA dehydrogenase